MRPSPISPIVTVVFFFVHPSSSIFIQSADRKIGLRCRHRSASRPLPRNPSRRSIVSLLLLPLHRFLSLPSPLELSAKENTLLSFVFKLLLSPFEFFFVVVILRVLLAAVLCLRASDDDDDSTAAAAVAAAETTYSSSSPLDSFSPFPFRRCSILLTPFCLCKASRLH